MQLAELYLQQGVKMLTDRATFSDGTFGVEAGIQDMLDRMLTGRFKIAKHLEGWWEEFRMYHRKEGIIVKQRDDLMAATRYAMMMVRHARTKKQVRDWSRPVHGELRVCTMKPAVFLSCNPWNPV